MSDPFPRTYRGVLIWPRNYCGMYSARIDLAYNQGTSVAADTLAGMREIITHTLRKNGWPKQT